MIDRSDLKIEHISTRPPGMSPVLDRGAVRITHIPSSTMVEVRGQRSGHNNLQSGIRMLEFYLTDPENR